jgi:type I restriction enzyme S subunit
MKCKLGELIEQRREKNPGGNLKICGISKEGFISPKQKEADTSIYNVFYLNDFVFNPARMELNSIVFNDVYDKAICSSLYEIFYVKRTDLIVPAYLGLWVKRNVFTRYCEFLGSGSAREYCRVANISEMEIEFPSIDEQVKLVKQYKVLKERARIKRRINDYLVA